MTRLLIAGCCLLFATVGWSGTAPAAPRLAVDTLVVDSDAPADSATVGRVHLVTENGTQTSARIGDFEYFVTPTWRPDGSIRLQEIVIHHYANGRDHTFGPYGRDVAPGDVAELTLGGICFSTKTSRAK